MPRLRPQVCSRTYCVWLLNFNMKISRQKFDDLRNEGRLALTLVGMSNIGKTAWSRKLAKNNDFKHICCDDLIEAKIKPKLNRLGYSGIHDMAKWLGQPYDERFLVNQQRYLDLETLVMNEILNDVDVFGQNAVIDTTGSVIYTGDEICSNLKNGSLVVYIEATPDMKEAMFKHFMANPKPIVWGDSFVRNVGETNMDALAGSYPKLLDYRSQLYEKYADIVIPYFDLDVYRKSVDDFFDTIKSYL